MTHPVVETHTPVRTIQTYHSHRDGRRLSYWRTDLLEYPGPEGERFTSRIRVTGETDTSPTFLGKYSSLCGYCYLGGGHSEDFHQESLLEAFERRKKDLRNKETPMVSPRKEPPVHTLPDEGTPEAQALVGRLPDSPVYRLLCHTVQEVGWPLTQLLDVHVHARKKLPGVEHCFFTLRESGCELHLFQHHHQIAVYYLEVLGEKRLRHFEVKEDQVREISGMELLSGIKSLPVMYGIREVESWGAQVLELTRLEWDGQKVRQFRGEVLKEARGVLLEVEGLHYQTKFYGEHDRRVTELIQRFGDQVWSREG